MDKQMDKQVDEQATSNRSSRRRLIIAGVVVVCLVGVVYGTWRGLSGNRDIEIPHTQDTPPKRDESIVDHPLDKALAFAYQQRDQVLPKITGYTARLKQEFGDKKKYGKPQVMQIKIRHEVKKDGKVVTPFSVYLKFEEPASAKGREVIWVKDQNNNKLIAHETGFKNLFRIPLAPNSLLAMMGNRYPITEIGIAKLVDKLIIRGENERKWPGCSVEIKKGVEFRGKTCTLIEVRHPVKKDHFDFTLAQIHVDESNGLPIHYVAYIWPEKEGGKPVLDEEYTYDDVKLNVELTDKDFDPDNEEYDYP